MLGAGGGHAGFCCSGRVEEVIKTRSSLPFHRSLHTSSFPLLGVASGRYSTVVACLLRHVERAEHLSCQL